MMHFPLSFLLLTLVELSQSAVLLQCLCDDYVPCEEQMPQESFIECLENCQKKVYPTEDFGDFNKCVEKSSAKMEKFVGCISSNYGKGCGAQKGRVIARRRFKKPRRKIAELVDGVFRDLGALTELDGESKQYLRFNSCLSDCYMPTNRCTKKLKCGLFVPPDVKFVERIEKCADKSGFGEGAQDKLRECYDRFPEPQLQLEDALNQ